MARMDFSDRACGRSAWQEARREVVSRGDLALAKRLMPFVPDLQPRPKQATAEAADERDDHRLEPDIPAR